MFGSLGWALCLTSLSAAEFYQGSWVSEIKATDSDPDNRSSCTWSGSSSTSNGWAAIDPEKTDTALRATGQNLLILQLESTSTSDCSWQNLETFLSYSPSPATSPSPSPSPITVVVDLPDDQIASATDISAAVASLRSIKASYSHLTALTVDDFHSLTETPEGGSKILSRADIVDLYNNHFHAASGSLPELEFWPYFPIYRALTYLLPSHVFGILAGTATDNRFYADNPTTGDPSDEIAVEFNIPASTFSPVVGPARGVSLSFVYTDAFNVADSQIGLYGEVTLTPSGSATPRSLGTFSLNNVSGNTHYMMGYFTSGVAQHSIKNGAALRIALKAEITGTGSRDYINPNSNKTISVGSVRFTAKSATPGGEVKVPITASNSTITYPVSRRSGASTSTSVVMTQDNSAYLLVNPSSKYIDGVVLKGESESAYYDQGTIRFFFKEVCGYMAVVGVKCLGAQWGYEYDDDFELDLSIKKQNMELWKHYADGIVVWNFPLSLADSSSGIFSERDPIHSGYSFMSAVPSYTQGIPELTHAWTVNAPTTGTYSLSWRDSLAVTTSLTDRYYRYVEVTSGGSVSTVYSEDMADDGGTSGSTTFSAAAGDTIVVKATYSGQISNLLLYNEFNVTDPSGTTLTGWTYGTSVKEIQEKIFDCVSAFFSGDSSYSTKCVP